MPLMPGMRWSVTMTAGSSVVEQGERLLAPLGVRAG